MLRPPIRAVREKDQEALVNDAHDKKRLQKAAAEFAKELQDQGLAVSIELALPEALSKLREVDSDGWFIRIAKGPGQANIEL
jgi:hypothetical protein